MTMLPQYDFLDLQHCPTYHGYYTLGLIQQCRPDIAIVTHKLARPDCWTQQDQDAELLRPDIETALAQHKTVLFVTWEEDVMGAYNPSLTRLVNSFKDDAFYFVSEMNSAGQMIFKDHHQFECKILELPFVLTNDCVCYAQIMQTLQVPEPPMTDHNFLCMLGRPEQHKFDLAACLKNHQVDSYGLITSLVPFQQVQVNVKPSRYHTNQLLTVHRNEAAQLLINNVWASSNVENFLHIQSTYDAPLIINTESTMGIFPATEKSIWPALLGRMYLIQAQPGAMKYVQQFHQVDQKQWADLEFDTVDGWDHAAHWQRRNSMIGRNIDLVKHARDMYHVLQQDLEQSRATFARNMYNFFKNQVDQI
jgi:hypothetical protein